ncbi:flagellar protein FlgN [Pectinatus sottacetonis]|uniref:flagellar protein FlgN n=1 Tax=Pectinatus sottacetonis TaxID=1002795 RepID=UPI0018C7B29D|nr:flagellar protein FlgN [Pectinatus sottacetonis]
MNELINILKQQLVKYKELEQNLKIQQQMFIAADNKKLQEQTNKIEMLVNQLKSLERKKQKIRELNRQAETVSPKDVYTESLSDKIKILAQAIKKVSDCNKTLLNNKMNSIQFSINVMTKVTDDSPYQSDGEATARGNNKIKMFDRSI